MQLRYHIVNVFSRGKTPFTGNALCVFEDAAALNTETMQALARQFNLSETTFLLPPTNPAQGSSSESGTAHARVRIFTPDYEMPFAGHPTLGSAFVARRLGLGGDALQLEMRAGIIPVRATGDDWTLEANAPTWRKVDIAQADLARLLGLSEADIGDEPLWVKAGKEQLVVPLTSLDSVRRTLPTPEFTQVVRSEDGQSMAYVFAMDTVDTAFARFFFPSGAALLEDPATGSATANLGGWCLAMGKVLPLRWTISQGEAVARPSTLRLGVDAARRVFVSGTVVPVSQGTFDL
jgi:trans-2,3-dihydro-3-hydroxyanthranilate isomerase